MVIAEKKQKFDAIAKATNKISFFPFDIKVINKI